LSVLLRFIDSGYPFGIFKLFLLSTMTQLISKYPLGFVWVYCSSFGGFPRILRFPPPLVAPIKLTPTI